MLSLVICLVSKQLILGPASKLTCANAVYGPEALPDTLHSQYAS